MTLFPAWLVQSSPFMLPTVVTVKMSYLTFCPSYPAMELLPLASLLRFICTCQEKFLPAYNILLLFQFVLIFIILKYLFFFLNSDLT